MFGRRWNRDVRNPGVKIDRISGRYRGGLLMKENPRRGGGTGKTRLLFVLNCCVQAWRIEVGMGWKCIGCRIMTRIRVLS